MRIPFVIVFYFEGHIEKKKWLAVYFGFWVHALLYFGNQQMLFFSFQFVDSRRFYIIRYVLAATVVSNCRSRFSVFIRINFYEYISTIRM